MNNIKSYFLSPFYWAKAIKMIKNANDLEAFEQLNNMHTRYTKNNYKYHLLKAFLALMLKDYEYSLILIDKSIFIISDNINLNDDEKKYLTKYAFSLMFTAYRMMDKFDEANEVDKNIKDLIFSVDNVKERIVQLFPQPRK